MRVFITQFLGAIAYLVVLIFVGAAGYVAIEGRPWREALYILVIERDPQRLERIHEHYPEVLTVFGDATLDENLRESGILKAQGLLSCLSADTDNVFVCLSARDLDPDLTIVARSLEEGSMDKPGGPIPGSTLAMR